jgi:fluoride exporter
MTTALPWLQIAAVAVGAALGALARWLAGLWLNPQWSGFPLGTLLVNCIGGLLIGAALAWFERSPNELARLLLVTGFLGGLTTFSAFSGESLLLLLRSEFTLALGHAAAHVFGSLVGAMVGFWVVRSVVA